MNEVQSQCVRSHHYRCVRALHNAYRSQALSRKYYGCRLQATKRLSSALDIALALGTSSAIGAWALWRGPGGELAWAIVSGFAVILAVVKPFLRLPELIEHYTRLFAGHAVAVHDFRRIEMELERSRCYSDEVHNEYLKLLGRARDLAPEDDPKPKGKLLDRCQDEVIREIPVESLWWPNEEGGENAE